MRKINILKNTFSFLLAVAVIIFTITSCIEDSDGSPEQSSGNLAFEEVTPSAAAVGNVITITGTGLGDIRSIVFDMNGAPARVVSTMNTSGSIVFSVPDTAAVGVQNIVLTNGKGTTANVPFEVLGFANITGVSNYNFSEGDQITLTGKNLIDITSVVFAGTSEEIEIVSQTGTQLVLTMPATEVTIASLTIENKAGLATTPQKFVNLDKAYKIFTDQYDNGFETNSWGGDAVATTAQQKTGTSSLMKTYLQGNWHVFGVAKWTDGVTNDGYNYLAFWIKGGAIDHTLYLTGDKRAAGGVCNCDETTPIEVPANVWSYHLIPMSVAKLWETAPTGAFQQLGFWIKGPDNQNETFYIDDLILVK